MKKKRDEQMQIKRQKRINVIFKMNEAEQKK